MGRYLRARSEHPRDTMPQVGPAPWTHTPWESLQEALANELNLVNLAVRTRSIKAMKTQGLT